MVPNFSFMARNAEDIARKKISSHKIFLQKSIYIDKIKQKKVKFMAPNCVF
jgi:hypothetical protein